VRVNGRIVAELGAKIDPAQDQVSVDGTPVQPEVRSVCIALNKPPGY